MTVLYIPDRGIKNVYHFLIYMLSNLRHIHFVPEVICIDMYEKYFSKNHDYVTEILKTLYPNCEIIDTQKKTCPNGFVSLPQHNSDPRSREGGIDSNAYIFLRNLLLPHIQNYKPSKEYSKRIYVSRHDTNKRRIMNEDEILEKLNGFEKIIMTNLPLLEQMYIFANAEVIVSCHGAALVNTLFCNDNVKIIEIASQKMSNLLHFQHIAETFHFNYRRFCDVDEIRKDNYDSDLIIHNIESFDCIIKTLV